MELVLVGAVMTIAIYFIGWSGGAFKIGGLKSA